MERNPSSDHFHSSTNSCVTKSSTERTSIITNDPNPGNFLVLLKYLAKFDPVMRSHLDSVFRKSGCILYLLPTIQNEIINLLGERVCKNIITACKLSLIHI